MKLSDYVFDFLKRKGVQCVFMLPGGGAMHLVDSLGASGIGYVPFLHEQGAAVAAEAYAQHTNTPGVCLVTSGPGATNAITAVTAGWIDSTPMFVISGQAKRSDLVGDKGIRQSGSQEAPTVSMVTPITKYAELVLKPEKIRYHLEKAWHEAVSGRPGPVWLDIPLDVQGVCIDEDNLAGYEPEEMKVSDLSGFIENAVHLIMTAKKPLILAGNGVKLSNAADEFLSLADDLGIPVQTTWKTADLLAEDHPLYVGHPGIMGDRGANQIIQESDLLLSIGARLDASVTAYHEEHFAYHAKKIIVDIDPNELKRMNVPNAVKAESDAGAFIRKLHRSWKALEESDRKRNIEKLTEWLSYCKEKRKAYPVVTSRHSEAAGRVCAYHFIDVLCEYLREDDVIVPESSGGAGEITYQAFRIKKGQKMKNAAGLGAMGFGLPYAIGSCIANGGRRTVLINGDGAFQLNIQELETARRLNLPIKIFVWCNEGYASIRAMQRNNFEGRFVASDERSGLTLPDIEKVAYAYGFKVLRIKDNSKVREKIREILSDDQPCVCRVDVDENETVSPRVMAHVAKDGSITSGLLEDMWPALADKELSSGESR